MIYGDDPNNTVPDQSAIIQSGNLYVYCGNNPVIHSDPSGMITKSITLGANLTALFGFSFSVGFSYDYKGNFVVHFSYAFPKSNDTMYIGGLDAGIAVSSQVTTLDTVDQLAGQSGYIGASGGYLGYLGVDAVFLPDNNGGSNNSPWIGAQVSAGLGVGADAHIIESNTIMSKPFNVWDFAMNSVNEFLKLFGR